MAPVSTRLRSRLIGEARAVFSRTGDPHGNPGGRLGTRNEPATAVTFKARQRMPRLGVEASRVFPLFEEIGYP